MAFKEIHQTLLVQIDFLTTLVTPNFRRLWYTYICMHENFKFTKFTKFKFAVSLNHKFFWLKKTGNNVINLPTIYMSLENSIYIR